MNGNGRGHQSGLELHGAGPADAPKAPKDTSPHLRGSESRLLLEYSYMWGEFRCQSLQQFPNLFKLHTLARSAIGPPPRAAFDGWRHLKNSAASLARTHG